LKERDRRAILPVLGFLTFSSVYTNVVMAPVLTQLGSDFHVTTGTAGFVVAAYGLPGILTAVIVGPYSDRFGRKRFLVGGSLVMSVFTIVAAFMSSFELLIGARALAGIGASMIQPNVQATVADNFPYRERGRAVSTVIGLNTLAAIVGIPVAGIVAEATSWRVSLGIVGTLGLLASLVILTRLPRGVRVPDVRRARALYAQILRNPSARGAIVVSFLGGLYWFTWITYIVVFFQRTFDLTQGVASTFALTQGVGVLIGSQLGGRFGDRVGHRRVVAGATVISAALLLLLTNAPVGLVAGAIINLGVSAAIGARFATNSVLLSEQVPEARGTMMSFSAALSSAAIVTGASIGGVLIDVAGFWLIGVFCVTVGVLSAAIVTLFVREEPIDLETQVA
jgi:predicted MFS family arabinose efflux permease